MYWNHRVVKIVEPAETVLMIAEVYYNSDTNRPFGYADASVIGDTLDEIHQVVAWFERATKQPILSYPEDFDLSEQDDDEDDEVPTAPV